MNPRRGKMLSTTLPINSLSGGVGRQAPPKRLPKEAEILENVLCTVERSIEKRPGVEAMPFQGAPTNDQYTGMALPLTGDSIEYFWHQLSDDVRFLICVDTSASGAADTLYYVFYYNQAAGTFEDHTPADQTGVDADVRAYLTHGSASELKMVAQAQNLVFLNPDVVAGYTSTTQIGGEWREIDLDGNADAASPIDVKGGEVTYTTATQVDPAGVAVYWDPFSVYAAGTTVLYLAGSQTGAVRATSLIASVQTLATPDASVDNAANWVNVTDRTAQQIDVKDWVYPDTSKPYYGQSVPTFQDLRFPPPTIDVESGNNSAEDMLAALYGLDNPSVAPHENSAEGKVYYVQGGFQGQAPGYYLMKSTSAPHTQKVRTPDRKSVLDAKRMPVEFEFTGFDPVTGLTSWEWKLLTWAHRTSGDVDTNPGPTPFKSGNGAKLTTMASFRGRLWFASGDVIFSSRQGDLTDLWLEDPGVITDTDPIDVAASSNKYTPITAMVPFSEYMFVNTSADTQYELLGSENQITPFTAELQPMTFYSTAPLVEPKTVGNHIFFFDRERLYMYLGRGGSLSTAQELSAHCPKYLPVNYGPTAVAPALDTLLAVDADEPEVIYMYTTRYRGNEIAQNAFYNFRIPGADIQSLSMWDNDLYMVNERDGHRFIERVSLRYEDQDIPRLDRRVKLPVSAGGTLDTTDPKFGAGVNAYWDVQANETTFRVPYVDAALDSVIFADGYGEDLGSALVVKNVDTSSGQYTDLTLRGDYTGGDAIYVGKTYTMVVQLSPQFLRDQQNNPREGVLNMASMTTRHFQTGNYDVLASRHGRPTDDVLASYSTRLSHNDLVPYTSTFSAKRVDLFDGSELSLINTEYQGELVSRIMGFSDKTDIYILSDYWTPVNITNIEIKGKFKQTYSSI